VSFSLSQFFLTIFSNFGCQINLALIYSTQLFDCLQAEELYGPRVSPPSLRGVFFIFFPLPRQHNHFVTIQHNLILFAEHLSSPNDSIRDPWF